MDQQSLFRKDSVERISSPEQLTDYLRVTTPTVWVLMIAIILLLIGMFVWGYFAYIESYVPATATVDGGKMIVRFDDQELARNIQAGMVVKVDDVSVTLNNVGRDENGRIFATALTTLANGSYDARVIYRTTQVLSLLFR